MRRPTQRALPNGHHMPSRPMQLTNCSVVPCLVSVKLCVPKTRTRCRYLRISAAMIVPETAVHEDSDPMSRENYVRPARKIFAVQPKTISARVQCPSHQYLRLSVPAANATHIEPALLWREDVNHQRACLRGRPRFRRGVTRSAAALFRPRFASTRLIDSSIFWRFAASASGAHFSA
jgi:hypothetical protein